MFKLDHLIIAVDNLDQASRDYAALGFTVLAGGKHANGASENALIVFQDGSYLELLAPTGAEPAGNFADFSFLTKHGEGLVGFALRSDDLAADAAAMEQRGLPMSAVATGGRKRPDGVELQWRTARLANGGLSPFFIQDVTARDLRVPQDVKSVTHANSAIGIQSIGIRADDLAAGAVRYAQLLNATPTTVDTSPTYARHVLFDLGTLQFRLMPSLPTMPIYPAEFGDVPLVFGVLAQDIKLFSNAPYDFNVRGTHFFATSV